MKKRNIRYNLLTDEFEYNADEFNEEEIEKIDRFVRNITSIFSEFDIENQTND